MKTLSKKYKTYLTAIIGALVLASFLFVNQCNQKSLIDKNQIYLSEYDKHIDRIRDSLELLTENMFLENYEVVSASGELKLLNSIISDQVLIYRFFENSCFPCIENDLLIIDSLNVLIENQNRIHLIPKFRNVNQLKIFFEKQNVKIQSFNFSNEFNIPIEDYSINFSPYFLLINEDLKIQLAYTSTPGHSIETPFFRIVLDYFQNK